MAKPRVIVTRRWPEPVERELEARYDAVLRPDDEPMSQEELATAIRECEALAPTVSDRIDSAVIGSSPRARIIANFGVGYSHVSLDAAQAAGVRVTNTPGVLTDATADLAMTLILMTARRAGEGERELRAGRWRGWRPTHMMGRDVTGQTLGIVGMGRIGKAVARRAALGFGMKVIFQNRSAVDKPGVDGARQVSLDELVETADFVSLHCPGGEETAGLISADRIAAMKPEAILINTARGEVVDEAALIEALREKRIAGAGLDVYADEPEVPEALRELENVVLLPHLGSATVETRVAMGMKVMENLDAFFAGAEPPDRVV